MAESIEELTVPEEPTVTPTVEVASIVPEATPPPVVKTTTKAKKEACHDLRVAAELALNHYRKTHTMNSPDDFKYPGFKELYKALNS